MYSTCTFCHAPLGANESLEAFPVGRRIAFDADKGRLWVVCPACRQWNLSPLDERWEAIEAAERLYRDTRKRVATDQVGLARLRDGTDLIRIGQPLRPEFAAWRYGDRFTLRWRRYALASTAIGAVAFAAGPLAGVGFSMFPYYGIGWIRSAIEKRRVIARLDDPLGPVAVTLAHAKHARILAAPDDPLGWQLSIPHLRRDTPPGRLTDAADPLDSRVVLTGPEAVEAARRILPHVNRQGARRGAVQEAVKVLEEAGGMPEMFRSAGVTVGRDPVGDPSTHLDALPLAMRLALEMAAHEEIERRALEGELAMLEAAWKEAEEVAAIADSLTLPEWVIERVRRLGG